MTTGFTGGGLLGPGFGLAIDAKDNAWMTSFAGNNNVALFDHKGKPLSPPEGWNFGGKLYNMQGIIVTPVATSGPPIPWLLSWFTFPRVIPSKGRVAVSEPRW